MFLMTPEFFWDILGAMEHRLSIIPVQIWFRWHGETARSAPTFLVSKANFFQARHFFGGC
jgi:hypothetical protein